MSKQENYIIRRSQREKRARIIVTAETIELVAPINMPIALLRQFADSKMHWIESTQKKIQKKTKKITHLSPEVYKEGSLLTYLGCQYPLSLQFSACSQLSFHFNDGFTVIFPHHFKLKNKETISDLVRNAYIDWLWQQSLIQVSIAAETYGKLYQLRPRSIRVRQQKSRWGSCGIYNDIYMNWLLILAPSPILEYVVIHEICHIKHRNHSKDFWFCVAKYCPEYKNHRAWLRAHGASLMQGI